MLSELIELIRSTINIIMLTIIIRILLSISPIPVRPSIGYVYIPAERRIEEVVELLKSMIFKAYGYRHWINLRSTNDVYDVVASPSHYVASDRDLVASPQVKEICVYSKGGTRISCINVNADNSFDIREDYSRIIYYNHNTGYIEEATIPDLTRYYLFRPGWTGDVVNAIVKYVPGTNYGQLCIARIGSNRIELRLRDGTVIDYMEFDKPIMAAACEPGGYVVALAEGDILDLVDTIAVYSFYSHNLYGLIPNLFGRTLNIHVKLPFITFGFDKGFALISEIGGTPYNVFPINTNCLYPLIEENLLIGTYYFSIFEFPLSPAFMPREIIAFRRDITLSPDQDIDMSFFKGTILTINSDQAIDIEVREPILISPGGYTKIYASSPPEYVVVSKYTGVNTARIEVPGLIWGNVRIKNISASTASISIVGGVA